LKEIQEARCLLGYVPKKIFYLFGSPIAHSLSPLLHNTGFVETGLGSQFKYEIFETAIISGNLLQAIESDEFGGASVTIPLKEAIIPHLDKLTESASKIKAVNTIIPYMEEGQKKLLGDNTDWLGILKLLEKSSTIMQPRILVIGAGGTSRAALFASCSLTKESLVYIWNRTSEKAILLAKEFNVNSLDPQTLHASHFDIIVSTIPGEAQASCIDSIGAAFSVAGRNSVFIEVAYRPAETEFMKLAKKSGFTVYGGIHVLIEQGFEQFKRWTGRNPSRSVMRNVVMSKYLNS
jgi:pentafunctional AROM polypeptide